MVNAEEKLFLKQTNLLNVCSYDAFEPMIYGKGEGYEADLLKSIVELWQVDIKFTPVSDYKSLLYKAADPDSMFDLVAGGFDPNCREPEANIVYSAHTAKYSQSLLVKTEDHEQGKIVDYTSFQHGAMTIGIVGNTSGEIFAKKRLAQAGVSTQVLKYFENEEKLLQALIAGDIHAVARGTVGNEFQASIDKRLTTIAKHDFGEQAAFVLDPKNAALKTHINAAIKRLTKDNSIGYDDWRKNHAIFKQA